MEIAPGVYTISIGQGAFTGVFPPNVYLVAGEHPVLLDSGYEADAPTRLGKLRELGLGVGRILLSHPHVDHIGGARPMMSTHPPTFTRLSRYTPGRRGNSPISIFPSTLFNCSMSQMWSEGQV